MTKDESYRAYTALPAEKEAAGAAEAPRAQRAPLGTWTASVKTTAPVPWATLLLLWAAWAAIILGFQKVVTDRFDPARPDKAVFWTATETTRFAQKGKPFLLEPFMNEQVSWDSEFYLAIAAGGYDDPRVRVANLPDEKKASLNYAFFPFYPYLIRVPYALLRGLDLTPIARLTLAGVLVSLLGTLGGMIALWDLARDELEAQGALRAVFYLLIFPTAFFLAQVYTEGLFVGLAFGSLALLRRKQWVGAALLAALATWTRPVGIALALPLGLAWLQTRPWQGPFDWRRLALGLLVLAPVAAHLLWRESALGQNFALVSGSYFGRKFIDVHASWESWKSAWHEMLGPNTQARIYYAIEFFSVALAFVACLFTLRRYPGLALFGLLALTIAVFSGAAQSMSRYVLVIPSNYLFLSRLGRRPVFDRAWTLASVLILGMSAALFSWDMWVG